MATHSVRDGNNTTGSHGHRLANARPRRFAGIIPNLPHQKPVGFIPRGDYAIAVVEFDDEGCAYERDQMALIKGKLVELSEQDAIIIVFTHGWKHDGRSDDGNLESFENLLGRTVAHERDLHEASGVSGPPRPVYGIFVAWRGLTLYAGGWLENLTFWGRQQAAHRVSTGAPRELFGRLRHYRNHRRKHGGSPLLVIVGHSFGGLIVYSALEQSLIEAASVAADHVVPGFADLVLLVNPAFGAARYLPIHTLCNEPDIADRKTVQLPVFVCATARNDHATGWAYPAGNLRSWFTENTRGKLQAKCLLHTIGHVDELITHRLSSSQGGSTFVLDLPDVEQPNPFWIVQAEPAVINGHSGIFQLPFLSFVASLVFVHVANGKDGPTPPQSGGGPSPDGADGSKGVAPLVRPTRMALPARTLSEIATSLEQNDADGR